jgi:uncharacterized membrane protein
MLRILHAILLGVVGATIVHIVVLFLMPMMSPRDAWSRLEADGDLYAFVPYAAASPAAGPAGIADPYFNAVVCRFDLADGFVHVFRDGKVPYWSASVYDRSGQNIFSLNDRTAKNGVLDLVVVTPAQLVDIRKSPPPELESSVFVEAPIDEGMVVVRGFQPDETWRKQIGDYLAAIACTAEPI